MRDEFEYSISGYKRWAGREGLAGPATHLAPYSKEKVDSIQGALIRYKTGIEMAEFERESSKTGSLKTAESKKLSAAEVLRTARLEEERQRGLAERKGAFDEETKRVASLQPRPVNIKHYYGAAMHALGNGTGVISNADFGRFLANARRGMLILAESILDPKDDDRARILGEINGLFSDKKAEIKTKAWQKVVGSYDYPGALGILAEKVKGNDTEKKTKLEKEVALACELAYLANAIEQTIVFTQKEAGDVNESDVWLAIAKITTEVFYDHVSDYPPIFGHALRGIGFSDFDHIKGTHTIDGELKPGYPFTRDEVIKLGITRYKWLYAYLRNLILTKTEFKDLEQDDIDCHLGDLERKVSPVGSKGQTPDENTWFIYCNLREIAAYRSEGRPLAFNLAINPSVIKADARVNEVYVAPLARQHMLAGIEEGPTLQRIAPVNVMITRGLREVENFNESGNTALVLDDAYMFLSREEFIEAYMSMHPEANRADVTMLADRELARNKKGIFCALRFSRPVPMDVPIPLHGHPLFVNGDFERLGYPHTVNGSREFEDAAYAKDLYPIAYDAEKGSWVIMPPEIDWKKAWALLELKGRATEEEVKGWIRNGKPGTSFTGLARFFADYPECEIIAKAARQSGGRQTAVFSAAQLDEAVDFLYEFSKSDDYAIQLYVQMTPSMMLTPQVLEKEQERLVRKGLAVKADRMPKTFLTLFARAMVVSSEPDRPHKVFHHLFGISVDKIGNVGRGGVIEEMLTQYMDERLRDITYRRIDE
ncbi:MAG: hypothetical protein ABH885_04510, partial [Candidatus Omnitrophota bacterium]